MNTSVLKRSISGINKMIASRREELRQMAEFLDDPFNSEKVYQYKTIYRRGPVLDEEIKKLVCIRLDLWRIIRKQE